MTSHNLEALAASTRTEQQARDILAALRPANIKSARKN